MKKTNFYLSIALLATGMMASCSSDPEFDSTETVNVSDAGYSYTPEGVWDENDQPGYLNIDNYEFSHTVDADGYVYGFTPSKVTDTSVHTPLYTFPYAAAAGGGLSGAGSQYLVGYWAEYLEGENCEFDNRTCRIYAENGDRFEPQSVMVCCNTYLMYAALNGTDFTRKFQSKDYVTLVAHGVHLDGTESQATFYLINIESTDVEEGIEKNWKEFDLSGLGTCTGVYFTMDCSQDLKSAYGLNIPTYFCLDRLVLKN